MEPPIIVYQNGDILIFDCAESAEAYIEPVDVKNGEYVACDADGHEIELHINTETRKTFIFFGKVQVDFVNLVGTNRNSNKVEAIKKSIIGLLYPNNNDWNKDANLRDLSYIYIDRFGYN